MKRREFMETASLTGSGEVNWRNVFKAIHDLGYQGIIGMEHGLSQPALARLLKWFEEYQKADSWA